MKTISQRQTQYEPAPTKRFDTGQPKLIYKQAVSDSENRIQDAANLLSQDGYNVVCVVPAMAGKFVVLGCK